MHQDFFSFVKTKTHDWITAVTNIFLFLPYFFSISSLIKTLFAPWKRIESEKKEAGFSLSDWYDRVSLNVVSRAVGFVIRTGLIGTYLVLQCLFMLSMPLIFLIWLLSLPGQYVLYINTPSADEKKAELKAWFMQTHLTDQKNEPSIAAWFEQMYAETHLKPWWTLDRLFTMPQLAYDWTSGYTPTLDQFAVDVSKTVRSAHPILGRVKEIEEVQQTLSKSRNANVILVGDEGSGRTSIIEGLAQAVTLGKVHPQLQFKRILSIDIEKIIAQTTDFAQRETILNAIFTEAKKAGNIILVMFDIDRFVSNEANRLDLSKSILTAAESEGLHILATTTSYAYQKYVFPQKSIVQAFTKLDVNEISSETTLHILATHALDYEKKFKLVVPFEALQQVFQLAETHITNIPQPEKSINLLDDVVTFAANQKLPSVNTDTINAVLTQKTHVPTSIDDTMKEKLLTLEPLLKKRIIQQDMAVSTVAASLRKAFVLSGSRKKPLASFLFLGPTGVGKTETAKALIGEFFGKETQLVRFDMSLYQSKNDIGKLVGDSATGEPGQLTEAIRKQPYGVLLLDELEKADKNLLNIFLTLLDEGYFTSGQGEKVDCKNLIIIATSNAGSSYISELLTKGETDIESKLIDHLISTKVYSPEFLNRFDGIAVYSPLSQQALLTIAGMLTQKLSAEILAKYKVTVTFSPEFLSKIVTEGYDPRFGARNLQRTLTEKVEDSISKQILEKTLASGSQLNF